MHETKPALVLQIYRANLPLARDVRHAFRLASGEMFIRVTLWNKYVSRSPKFLVKAKQQAGEKAKALGMRPFKAIGDASPAAVSPVAAESTDDDDDDDDHVDVLDDGLSRVDKMSPKLAAAVASLHTFGDLPSPRALASVGSADGAGSGAGLGAMAAAAAASALADTSPGAVRFSPEAGSDVASRVRSRSGSGSGTGSTSWTGAAVVADGSTGRPRLPSISASPGHSDMTPPSPSKRRCVQHGGGDDVDHGNEASLRREGVAGRAPTGLSPDMKPAETPMLTPPLD